MNSKMTTNSQLSTTKYKNKNKLSKQLEQDRFTEIEITLWEGYQHVGGAGRKEGRYRE